MTHRYPNARDVVNGPTLKRPRRDRPTNETIREKKKAKAEEGQVAWYEHLAKQKAVDDNMARLKAERLKREAATPR